ncbi:MAG: SPOR domain-containing protein [Bacteroidales bacterium]|nr:SPOR domain-containing protein [Bacteroidales bacterium]
MNRICNAISQLLYEHDKVIVPGLGAFLREDEGAQVNIVTNTFVKPSSILVFDAQQREDNDLIASFLTTNEGMAKEEARQLLAQFVSDCFADLKTGKEVHLTGVGTLTMGSQQQWIFQSDPDIDYNTDAFGLSDFSVTPVFTSGKQDDWKAQVAQQIKDKNTPMTVDSKRVRRNFEMENDAPQPRRRGRGVLFTLLGLLLLAGIFVLLSYLKLIPVTLPFFEEPKPMVVYHTPGKPIDPELQQQLFAYYTYEAPAPETAAAEIAVDTTAVEAEQISPEEVMPEPAKPETTAPSADTYRFDPPETSKVFIIGGCYSMEENAVTQIKTVREQGFANAFVMKRGSKYYVCYGHFATAEDAKEELAKVRPYNAKAWLLTKK